ncbi:MAG: hypothetical protein LRZ84_22890 [Desertifilum sp.]|nr:hypothetical protein [Desertifilum sp.]
MPISEIERLILEMPDEDKERLLSSILQKLPVDMRSRVLGLTGGLTVVTGSFVSLNSDIAVNVQSSNSTNFDPETLIKALLEYRHRKQG